MKLEITSLADTYIDRLPSQHARSAQDKFNYDHLPCFLGDHGVTRGEREQRMDDRRKYQRFKLDNTCIVNHSRTVGTIMDISIGGMSCICLDQGDCEREPFSTVNIYCRDKELTAESVKVNILESELVSGHIAVDLGIRKCRASFDYQDEAQRKLLEDIIVASTTN